MKTVALLMIVLLAVPVLAKDWSKDESWTEEAVKDDPEGAFAANPQKAVQTYPAVLETPDNAKAWFTGQQLRQDETLRDRIEANLDHARKYFETQGGLVGKPGETYLNVLTNGAITVNLLDKTLSITGKALSNVRGTLDDITKYPAGTIIRPKGDDGFEIILPGAADAVDRTVSIIGAQPVTVIDYDSNNGVKIDGRTINAVDTGLVISILPTGLNINGNVIEQDFISAVIKKDVVHIPADNPIKTITTARLQVELKNPLYAADPASNVLNIKIQERVEYAAQGVLRDEKGVISFTDKLVLQGDATVEFGKGMVRSFAGEPVILQPIGQGYMITGRPQDFYATTRIPVIENGQVVGQKIISMPTESSTVLLREADNLINLVESQVAEASGDARVLLQKRLDSLKNERATLDMKIVAAFYTDQVGKDKNGRPWDGNMVYFNDKAIVYGRQNIGFELKYPGSPERDLVRSITGLEKGVTLALNEEYGFAKTVEVIDNPVKQWGAKNAESYFYNRLKGEENDIKNIIDTFESKGIVSGSARRKAAEVFDKYDDDEFDDQKEKFKELADKERDPASKSYYLLQSDLADAKDKLYRLHDTFTRGGVKGFVGSVNLASVTDVHADKVYGLIIAQPSNINEPITIKANKATVLTDANVQQPVDDRYDLLITSVRGTTSDTIAYIAKGALIMNHPAITGGERNPTHWYSDTRIRIAPESVRIEVNDYEDAIREFARTTSSYEDYAIDLLSEYQNLREKGKVQIPDVVVVSVQDDSVEIVANTRNKAKWSWSGASMFGTGSFGNFGEEKLAGMLAQKARTSFFTEGSGASMFSGDYAKLLDKYVPGLGTAFGNAIDSGGNQLVQQRDAIVKLDKVYGARITMNQNGGVITVNAVVDGTDLRGKAVNPSIKVDVPLNNVPDLAGKDLLPYIRQALAKASRAKTVSELQSLAIEQSKEQK